MSEWRAVRWAKWRPTRHVNVPEPSSNPYTRPQLPLNDAVELSKMRARMGI